jgi:hypothetical protein
VKSSLIDGAALPQAHENQRGFLMTAACSRRIRIVRAARALLPVLAALAGGCGHSTTAPPGTPVITFGSRNSSPDPDFAAYIVAIDSISLTANDGTVVTPLITPEIVDLEKYTSVTELVEAPAVPSGTYVSATITLDYSAASIWINFNGQPLLASVFDDTGAAFITQTVTVTFDPDHPLVVTAGQSVRLHVDVDLIASNTLTSTGPVRITAQPFAVISPAPQDATVMRARGLYVTTLTVPSGFFMNLRPFFDLVSALGALTVNTNAQTYFNINGVAYTGAAGLAAINTLQESTLIVADGTLDSLVGITPSFNATAIYAGTSQENPLDEQVSGTVSARSGDTLTLLGVTYQTPLGLYQYYADIPVGVGSGTLVSEDGVNAPGLSIGSISVGQEITVSGQAGLDATTGNLVDFDGTAGQVRLAPTQLWSTLSAVTPGSVTGDIVSLDNWASEAFNFKGTASGAGAVSPNAYVVNTGNLATTGITAGTLVQMQGSVAPFGLAPPDFTASSMVRGSSTEQVLVAEWTLGGATTPFSATTDAGLVIDLHNPLLSGVHSIRTGPTSIDLQSLPSSPLITTAGAPQNELELAIGSSTATGGIYVYNSNSGFIAKVQATFNGSNKIFRLTAYGQYNSTTNTFVATRIHVALEQVSPT